MKGQTNNLSPRMPRSGCRGRRLGGAWRPRAGAARFSLREQRSLVRCCSSDAAPVGSQRKETEVRQAFPTPLPSARGGDGRHAVASSFETKTAPEEKAPKTRRVPTGPPDPGPVSFRCILPAPRHLPTAALHASTCVAAGWELRQLSPGLEVPSLSQHTRFPLAPDLLLLP